MHEFESNTLLIVLIILLFLMAAISGMLALSLLCRLHHQNAAANQHPLSPRKLQQKKRQIQQRLFVHEYHHYNNNNRRRAADELQMQGKECVDDARGGDQDDDEETAVSQASSSSATQTSMAHLSLKDIDDALERCLANDNDSSQLQQGVSGDDLENNNMDPSSFHPSSGCAICRSNFEIHQRICSSPVCPHVFHLECIMAWLLLKSGNRHHMNDCCPICRKRWLR